MKPAIKTVLPLLLAILLLSACGKTAQEPAPTAQPTPAAAKPPAAAVPTPTPEPTPAVDASGAYLLSERGEAILDEPWFSEARRAEGNARVFYEIFVGFISTLDGESVCVLHNPTGSPITADLSQATELRFSRVDAAVGQGDAALDGTTITLGAMTSAVLR